MKERKEHDLEHKTVSLWSYLNRPEILQQYLNPLYEPNATVLWPSVAPQSLVSQLYVMSLTPSVALKALDTGNYKITFLL